MADGVLASALAISTFDWMAHQMGYLHKETITDRPCFSQAIDMQEWTNQPFSSGCWVVVFVGNTPRQLRSPSGVPSSQWWHGSQPGRHTRSSRKQIDPKNQEFVVHKRGQPALYVHITKAIHGILVSAMLFYRKLVADLQAFDFELNPCGPCVTNKTVGGSQMTVSWHVYDLKVSHIDPKQFGFSFRKMRALTLMLDSSICGCIVGARPIAQQCLVLLLLPAFCSTPGLCIADSYT
eukprot:scaffold4240_cov163-Amphora_coffeaeformis.AAC.1